MNGSSLINRGFAAWIAFLLTVAGAHAQTAAPPTEFAGVPLNATVYETKKVMENTPDTHLRRSRPDYLDYTGGVLAGQQIFVISFGFDPRQLSRAAALFKPGVDPRRQYGDIRSLLVAKYGEPTVEKRAHKEPHAIWHFPATVQGRDGITITCEMVNDAAAGLSTKLVYIREAAPIPGKPAATGL